MEKSNTKKQSDRPTLHTGFYTGKKLLFTSIGLLIGTDLQVKFANCNFDKAPPGQARNPGIPRGHPPDVETGPPKYNSGPPVNQTLLQTEKEIFKQYNKNFMNYKHFNFSTMKKQILFLAVFVLAVLAGTKSFAQDKNYIDGTSAACAPVTPLTCATDDELHPIPGKTYNYVVTVNPGVTTGNVQWFVYNATTNGTIITAGSISAAVSAAEADGGTSQFLLDAENGKYNSATNTSGSIDVSWQSFDGATNRILLVAYVQGENGCSDNIEVWRIEPIFAFTLDIAGLMPDGTLPATGTNAHECVSPVQSAVYDGTNLTMDYGENYVFFTVTAANFVHSWQPTFTIVANNTETTVAVSDIEWAYPTEAIKTTGGTWNSATTPILAQATGGAVGAGGECIVVRVHLDHGNAENDANAARSITIGVDGVMYNVPTTDYSNASLKDLDPVATAPCTNTVTDEATYDLDPRPEITESNPAAPSFEPKN